MREAILNPLPPKADIESKAVLKQLARAHRALAELKGYLDTIPDKNMLINAITIKEAKDSSEIENIITTHDELFKAMSLENYNNPAAKEVVWYRAALRRGYELVKEKQMITTDIIVEIQELIEKDRAGIRKLPGTVLKNALTGEVVHTPPGSEHEILTLMSNLEGYINNDSDNVDPLIKLAVIHYQFEAIHPFYDGNGRTGRIINVLYLVLKGLLNDPILYLSGFIMRNKMTYYRLLQEVSTKENWDEWVLFILEGIEQTAKKTFQLVKKINQVIPDTMEDIKKTLPHIYSEELAKLLFFELYIKISHIEKGLKVTRKTASGYLSELERCGFLESQKVGREKIYANKRLYEAVWETDTAK